MAEEAELDLVVISPNQAPPVAKILNYGKYKYELEKKAKEIRKKNMKEFESILTREQRKILKNMKKEGRKKYQQAHPVGRPPMHFTTPNGQPSIKK